MKILAITFEDRTFRYDQLEREGMVALYSQMHKASGIKRYEVVRIRIDRARTWPNGTETPEQESYPGANAWGRYGHTFHTHASAQNHFHTLLADRASATNEEH